MLEGGEGARLGICALLIPSVQGQHRHEESVRLRNAQLPDNLPVGEVSFEPLAGTSWLISWRMRFYPPYIFYPPVSVGAVDLFVYVHRTPRDAVLSPPGAK